MFNKNNIRFISLSEATQLLSSNKVENGKIECIMEYKESYKQRRQKIDLNDSILLMLSAIEYNRKVISRTLMQREVFLFYEEILKELGLSKGAKEAGFFPYKYGPYSIDVNIALSTLIFSGEITVSNHYGDQNEEKRKKFLTVFNTDSDFYKIAAKYEETLLDKGVSLTRFQELVRNKKQAWDQNTVKGITKLLLSKGFKEWCNKKTLEDTYPSIHFGKITEDYKPKVKS